MTDNDCTANIDKDGTLVFKQGEKQEVTKEKIWGRYIIREALEGMAARLASKNITDKDKDELYSLASRCDKELHENDLTANEKANLHYQLHAEIVSITKCEELISLINRINLHSILFSNAFHVNWKEDWGNTDVKITGLIAQEVETALEGRDFIGHKVAADGYQELKLEAFIPVLINAVKELEAKVKDLESKL